MSVFYNEHDPFAAEWLRHLIRKGLIADGIVDERDIQDIVPSEIMEFNQCHFFAGIAGWSLALQIAGWPDDKPIWTGSCPCQSFSAAGSRAGFDDERHLWPAFHHLIRQCRPAIVVGEQVETAVRLGWLDLVQADLEGEGYAFGFEVQGAHSVGAPHVRQRLWWVACGLGNPVPSRSSVRECEIVSGAQWNDEGGAIKQPSRSPWADLEWQRCRDGKYRATQSGIQPLAHGVPNRVGTLRGVGNAIVPQAGAVILEVMKEYASLFEHRATRMTNWWEVDYG